MDIIMSMCLVKNIGDFNMHSYTKAFTMAEVLITLGIIGIIAAMTLPSLIANHRRQVTLTKVKQTYTILNNALERAKVDYDTDVTRWYMPNSGKQLVKSMFFVETYILPYLQSPMYCKDEAKAPYCVYKFRELTGNDYFIRGLNGEQSGTMFYLNNGASVQVTVGPISSPAIGVPGDESINRVLITFDIDGPKGFNRNGYDIFEIELGGKEGPLKGNKADKNRFLPYLYDYSKPCSYYVSEVNHACNKDVTYPGGMCLAYIVCNGWAFGDKYPW